MKLTYDPKANIAYVRLREKPAEVEALHISDEMNINLTPDGTIYGIELLNATEQLAGDEIKRFVLENPSTGKSTEVLLPL